MLGGLKRLEESPEKKAVYDWMSLQGQLGTSYLRKAGCRHHGRRCVYRKTRQTTIGRHKDPIRHVCSVMTGFVLLVKCNFYFFHRNCTDTDAVEGVLTKKRTTLASHEIGGPTFSSQASMTEGEI